MSDEVISEAVALVFAHGDRGEALLWREYERFEPEPAVAEPELAALTAAVPLAEEAIGDILSAARRNLIELAASHPCGETMRRARPSSLRRTSGFIIPVIRDRMNLGVRVFAWGEPRILVWGRLYVDEEAHKRVMAAACRVDPNARPFASVKVSVRLVEPAAGDRIEDVGQRAAIKLWGLARDVVEML